MSANKAVYRRFADDRLHIFFALAARYFSDDLPVYEEDLSKYSDDQEFMITRIVLAQLNGDRTWLICLRLALRLWSKLSGRILGDIKCHLTGHVAPHPPQVDTLPKYFLRE